MDYLATAAVGIWLGYVAGYYWSAAVTIAAALVLSGMALFGDQFASSEAQSCRDLGGDLTQCMDNTTKFLLVFLATVVLGAFGGAARAERFW